MALNPKASEFHPETLNPTLPISSIQEPIYLPPQYQVFHSYEGCEAVFYHHNGFFATCPYNYYQQNTGLYQTYSELSYEFRNADQTVQTGIQNCKKASMGFNKAGFKGFKGFVPPRLAKGKLQWKTRQVNVLKKNSVPVGDVAIVPEVDRFQALVSGNTSIMIKNVPNGFGRWDMLRILDDHCREENIKESPASRSQASSYDFLYLPMDFTKHANLGYAFVNFTNATAAVSFCRAFDKYKWNFSGNKKICEVTIAKLQGKEAFIQHFRNSKFVCHTNEYLPVVLSPPSDGVVRYRLLPLGICTGCRRRRRRSHSIPPCPVQSHDTT